MQKTKLILLFASIIFSCSEKDAEHTYDLAIQNVAVFDSKKKEVIDAQTLLINSDTIALIIDSSRPFKAKTTIKKNGNLVVPGFIDTHMHLTQIFGDGNWIAPEFIEDEVVFKRVLAEQYLKHGVTTIFDMGSPEKWLDVTLKWQKTSSPSYPNIYMTGGALKSDESYEPNMNHAEVLNPSHAHVKVAQYDSLGIKHLKLYSSLNRPELKAVVEKAKEIGLTIYGHIDRNNITLNDAMDMGVYNFEHFFTVAESVFNLEDYEQEFSTRFGIEGVRSIDEYSARLLFLFVFIKEKPELESKMNELVEKLSQSQATISTTIHVLGAVARKTDFFTSFQTYPLRNQPYFPSFSKVEQKNIEDAFDVMMAFLLKMHQKGIKIRIGTDTRLGGRAFLSEMQLMQNAGFSMKDIFAIATINAAEAMAVDNLYGSIEIGKKADLIIFDKDPFEDFENIVKHKTIIKGGVPVVLKPTVTNTMYELISEQGVEKGLEWYRENKDSDTYLKPKKSELNEVAYLLLKDERIAESIALLKEVRTLFPNSSAYNDMAESQLNTTGYYYLQIDKEEEALGVFKYIVELFPTSWNAHDSLGEAYLANNQEERSIESYEKSIELNPGNTHGINMLKKLKNK